VTIFIVSSHQALITIASQLVNLGSSDVLRALKVRNVAHGQPGSGGESIFQHI
jgi:hypothetical protein